MIKSSAYGIKEVCNQYKVHPNTVRRMVKDGRLKAGRAGGKNYRFSPEECDRVFLGIEPKEEVAAA